MTVRKPVVIGPDGLSQQLQAGDTLGANALFSGSSTFGFSISVGGTQYATVTVSPAQAGDSLSTADKWITITPGGRLPSGINIASAYVTGTNTVEIAFTSSALVSLGSQTITWYVAAHRF